MRTRRFPCSFLVVIAGLCLGTLACTPNPNAPPLPAAAAPEFPPGDPADPTGTPAPAGAPVMFTRLIKFRIPTGTVFEVAENGWMLRESNTTQCGDDGCYQVLARQDDGAGKTTWIIQVWPEAYRRFANQLKYIITNVSLNNTLTGLQLASRPETLLVSPGVGGTLGGPTLPAFTPGTPEWATQNQQDALGFVLIGLSNAAEAAAYYLAVDPGDNRLTLNGFKTTNGFSLTDDSQDEATAHYFNAGDLALGRSMHLKSNGGDIAYYVSNYPTVEDAVRGTNLVATVAMDYSPIAPGGARVMKFFVYGADGARVDKADLDGNGAKFIPNLCIICHGVSKYTLGGSADVGARFLPFDLSSYQYALTRGRNGQEAAFKKLNEAMRPSNRSQATEDLILKWYEDPAQPTTPLASATQNDDAVPNGWSSAGQSALYLNVVKPGCRSCHVSRDETLGFGSFASFNARGSTVYSTLCSLRTMPNAKVNNQKFWLDHLSPQAGGSMVGVLNASGVNGWAGACPVP